MLRKLSIVAAAGAALVSGGAVVQAQAEPAAGVTVVCPYTGPGIAICAGIGVVLHELVQIGNGKKGFGPNGEIMKVLAVPVKIADGNLKGAERESGELDKLIRATLGISIRDIKEYGLCGGPNSVCHKPFG